MASPTVWMVFAASSGISTPNASLERLDEHDLVDQIGAKIVREIGAGDDFVFPDTELFHNNPYHKMFDILVHGCSFLVLTICSHFALAALVPGRACLKQIKQRMLSQET
jgi:hypothetical protein